MKCQYYQIIIQIVWGSCTLPDPPYTCLAYETDTSVCLGLAMRSGQVLSSAGEDDE